MPVPTSINEKSDFQDPVWESLAKKLGACTNPPEEYKKVISKENPDGSTSNLLLFIDPFTRKQHSRFLFTIPNLKEFTCFATHRNKRTFIANPANCIGTFKTPQNIVNYLNRIVKEDCFGKAFDRDHEICNRIKKWYGISDTVYDNIFESVVSDRTFYSQFYEFGFNSIVFKREEFNELNKIQGGTYGGVKTPEKATVEEEDIIIEKSEGEEEEEEEEILNSTVSEIKFIDRPSLKWNAEKQVVDIMNHFARAFLPISTTSQGFDHVQIKKRVWNIRGLSFAVIQSCESPSRGFDLYLKRAHEVHLIKQAKAEGREFPLSKKRKQEQQQPPTIEETTVISEGKRKETPVPKKRKTTTTTPPKKRGRPSTKKTKKVSSEEEEEELSEEEDDPLFDI